MLEANPPEAPHSGVLVITDEEAESQDTLCCSSLFGSLCKKKKVKKLPFVQDKILTVVYTSEYRETTNMNVWFIPVPNQPLSSNRYYVIRAKGRHRGKACTCSRECDIMTCCFRDISRDKKPKPLNPKDTYQQVKIHHHHSGGFFAKSVALDGLPPKFLRRKGWKVRCSSLNQLRLSEAIGLDAAARAQLPDLNFSVFNARSPCVQVGKWHCPFPFVRERGLRVQKQMRKSMYYTMTLEQWWEEIFSCRNANTNNINNNSNDGQQQRQQQPGNSVVRVDVNVQREVCLVGGAEAVKDERSGSMTWFKVYNPNGKRGVISVGLSYAIVENMRWVLDEGGWACGREGGEREVRVEMVEENVNEWRRFGCYVLVESFLLRRLDGSLVLKCSFRHTQRTKCKWE